MTVTMICPAAGRDLALTRLARTGSPLWIEKTQLSPAGIVSGAAATGAAATKAKARKGADLIM
jgi:hypothetical protein